MVLPAPVSSQLKFPTEKDGANGSALHTWIEWRYTKVKTPQPELLSGLQT